ncbi:hypothetical protein Nepgr_025612 [Nepenthes gracilis]|uniref:Uncharacterized protein n=1 Tax=Nepenthes gracilis TaxID=150966 RepID=A0AAD3T6S3_NEPGR|nr:hypothetical protein Nepgr_025612 [Nepenthes gracilis]
MPINAANTFEIPLFVPIPREYSSPISRLFADLGTIYHLSAATATTRQHYPAPDRLQKPILVTQQPVIGASTWSSNLCSLALVATLQHQPPPL